ncbi:MAG: Asp-tRNA(Asn)/Glu-tRNA(Gln) amidotransferase subunit GatC [Bacillota bacterium]
MTYIDHLEYLSKLSFTDEEKVAFDKDFSRIIAFVDEIKAIEIDDDGAQEATVTLADLREDVIKESLSVDKILANAPREKDGCFLTPLVVE